MAIGCDEAGNSHMIWDCSDGDGTCQARIDQYGYWLWKNKLDTDYEGSELSRCGYRSFRSAPMCFSPKIILGKRITISSIHQENWKLTSGSSPRSNAP